MSENFELRKPINPEKEKRWAEIAERVEQIKDKLGKPIDAGIKEAVIAFQCLGFETRQSCEGHPDWGVKRR